MSRANHPAFPPTDGSNAHRIAHAATMHLLSKVRETAYTKEYANIVGGMTLREHYAGLAMQGLLAGFYACPNDNHPKECAHRAVIHADCLLAALEEPKAALQKPVVTWGPPTDANEMLSYGTRQLFINGSAIKREFAQFVESTDQDAADAVLEALDDLGVLTYESNKP